LYPGQWRGLHRTIRGRFRKTCHAAGDATYGGIPKLPVTRLNYDSRHDNEWSAREDPVIDTSDMVLAHRLFHRELRNAPELIGGVEAGDTKRSALIADHLAQAAQSP
jgi:hypothetical protein